MREYSATELANNTGDVLSAAAQEAVEITRHGKPRYVLMSRERYQALMGTAATQKAVRVAGMSDAERQDMLAALDAELGDD